MAIKNSSHFTYKKIILISLPTIIATFLWTLTSFLDGIFISNFISTNAFEAFTYVFSYINIFYAIAYISAYAAFNKLGKLLGENNKEEANKKFYMLLIFSIFIGLVILLVSLLSIRSVLSLLGASGDTLNIACELGTYICCGLPFFTLYNFLKDIDYISEKRFRSLITAFIFESLHIVLSIIFVIAFKIGIKGVGIATIISWGSAATYYLIYYFRKNDSLLQIKISKFSIKDIGSSFMISLPSFLVDLAGGIMSLLTTFQAYKYFAGIGVIANGAASNIFSMLACTGCGLTLAIMPMFSYNYGAKNKEEINSMFKKCLVVLSAIGLLFAVITVSTSYPLAILYNDNNEEAISLTKFAIIAVNAGLILTFLNYFASAFLISVNQKVRSMISSFTRVAFLWPMFIFVLPLIFNNGKAIYFALLATDVIALIVNVFLIRSTKLIKK